MTRRDAFPIIPRPCKPRRNAMPTEITMPQQSDTMTEGTVVKWLKKEGDKVKSGEVIAEIETDKATMEMESFEGGTIAKITAPEGMKVAVGQMIATERGVDLSKIKGSGPGGRIVKQDVIDAAPALAPQKVEARALQPTTG